MKRKRVSASAHGRRTNNPEQKQHMRLPNLKYQTAKPLANLLKIQESVLGVAGATGLEPAASAVTGQRSNQLSYAPAGVCPSYRRPKGKSR